MNEEQQDGGDGRSEVLALLKELEAKLEPEQFNEFVDEALKNERWMARMKRQEREERVTSFQSLLYEMTPDRGLPEDFAERWEELLASHEEQARDDFSAKVGNPQQIDKFVRRGWCSIDPDKRELVTSLVQPSSDLHPIDVVLVFENGRWHVPVPLMECAVKQHPFVRRFTQQLPPTTTADLILGKIEWARKRWSEPDPESQLLAEAAECLDLALMATMSDDPADSSWLQEAREKEPFWAILNSAIGFGRRLALFEAFRGGTVDEATRWALLMPPGKKPSPKFLIVESLMKEFAAEQSKPLTPKRLLKWLGVSKLGAADEFIQFPESSRGRHLGFITWPKFQAIVKSVKRKGL